MKIPLKTARRLFPDQLRPFDGLQNYSIDLDFYDGTLYRLPLRLNQRTMLKENSADIDIAKTKGLLEEYYSTARMSLLFLRNVTAIDFSTRGQPVSWSVKSERSDSSFEEVFRQVIVESRLGADESSKMVWRIGIMDIDEAPDALANPGRRANKITECGLATCIEEAWHSTRKEAGHAARKEAQKQRIFCTLPTLSPSGLPVSVHASFAITGDRKTIPFENHERQSPLKEWNRWLLTKCIPEFYIEFLKDLAPKLGEASFKFWPVTSTMAFTESFGQIVQEAFWSSMASQQYEDYQLYPHLETLDALLKTPNPSEQSTPLKTRRSGKSKKLFKVASLKSAQFDVLPKHISLKLRPLFSELCPSLVYPPPELWRCMTTAKIHQQAVALEPEYICALFKTDSNCSILQDFLKTFKDDGKRDQVLEMFLRTAVPSISSDSPPHSMEIANNCRIVPLLDGTLGVARFRDQASAPFQHHDLLFLPSDVEAELFKDHVSSLIKPTLFRGPAKDFTTLLNSMDTKMQSPRNPLRDMMMETSNLRDVGITDIQLFLTHINSSLTPSSTLGPSHNWVIDFWSYLNPRLETYLNGEGSEVRSAPVIDLLIRFKLHDAQIYRYAEGEEWRYITPEQFEAGPYVIQPADAKQVELCKQLNGVKVLDPECMPSRLRKAESDLSSLAALRRLLKTFARVAEMKGRNPKLFKGTVDHRYVHVRLPLSCTRSSANRDRC